jgi:sec-independent protein translocase protein TatA
VRTEHWCHPDQENPPMSLGAPELLIVLAVVMLLFGAKKVPDLARSLGQAKREFEAETRGQESPDRTA